MKKPSSAASKHLGCHIGHNQGHQGKNLQRSYITGSKGPDSKKLPLIIEIRKKRSERCDEIIGIIFSKLKEEKLTKEEAWKLREPLCRSLEIACFPCQNGD